MVRTATINTPVKPFKAPLLAASLFIATSASAQVTLTVSPTSSILGQPITLTAAVAPSAASGTVAFYDGVNLVE
jgi:hypothetical protein